MERIIRPLSGLPGTLLIVAVAMAITWITAWVALSRMRSDVLAADLSSSLKADYTGAETASLSPISSAIVESVTRDRQEQGATEIVFAPIYLGEEGNQEPVRLPSGEVIPAPTPSPTGGRPPSATPQPGGPTPQVKPTREVPTPKPEPTKPEQPTPKPTREQPTPQPQPTHEQPTPKPTQEQPTPRPQPTPKPTPRPHPTRADHGSPDG